MNELKIPKARVAVLIGKKGEIKKRIEKLTEIKLNISKEGDVLIEGTGLGSYLATEIVKAIGRGFNPKIALRLLKENYVLIILNIKEYTGKSEKKFERIKGRIIGKKGFVWKMLEEKTNTNVSIYGKTVSVLGLAENVDLARRAFEKLLYGAPHNNVYKFIELELKKREE